MRGLSPQSACGKVVSAAPPPSASSPTAGAARRDSMVVLRSVSTVLSLILGGQVSLVARPPANAPLAFVSARCEEFSFSLTEGRRILPFKCVAAPAEPRAPDAY